MSKNSIIIGGGISGLALLHYLKKKYVGDDTRISLLEKNSYLGGTIRSLKEEGCLFETGPNGFLDSKPRTLEFVEELGLTKSLVRADEQAKIRYLSANNALHQLPTGPAGFLSFKLLNPLEKLRVLGEFFVAKGVDSHETVYDFGKRRLGERFSQVFLDPMVSGIYGGDAQKANLRATFPRIHQMEQEYGSLFKAMGKIRKQRKAEGKANGKVTASPTGTLTSFQGGVGELIEAIGQRYKGDIHFNTDVHSILREQDQYKIIDADGSQSLADELFICAPAYCAARMVKMMDGGLSKELERINYAPMMVVGLAVSSDYFKEKPKGYGYLIPSTENKEVLGVLFESNIFPGRCPQGQMLFRVMIGGARHPDILEKTDDELIRLALNEIEWLAGKQLPAPVADSLENLFFTRWEKAIPQYDRSYCEVLDVVERHNQKNPALHFVANYLKGVSLNDCIENAFQASKVL